MSRRVPVPKNKNTGAKRGYVRMAEGYSDSILTYELLASTSSQLRGFCYGFSMSFQIFINFDSSRALLRILGPAHLQ